MASARLTGPSTTSPHSGRYEDEACGPPQPPRHPCPSKVQEPQLQPLPSWALLAWTVVLHGQIHAGDQCGEGGEAALLLQGILLEGQVGGVAIKTFSLPPAEQEEAQNTSWRGGIGHFAPLLKALHGPWGAASLLDPPKTFSFPRNCGDGGSCSFNLTASNATHAHYACFSEQKLCFATNTFEVSIATTPAEEPSRLPRGCNKTFLFQNHSECNQRPVLELPGRCKRLSSRAQLDKEAPLAARGASPSAALLVILFSSVTPPSPEPQGASACSLPWICFPGAGGRAATRALLAVFKGLCSEETERSEGALMFKAKVFVHNTHKDKAAKSKTRPENRLFFNASLKSRFSNCPSPTAQATFVSGSGRTKQAKDSGGLWRGS